MESLFCEDAVYLQQATGSRVAEGGFEVPESEALRGEVSVHLRHKGFAFVEGDEGHFELQGNGAGQNLGGSGEDVGFVTLDVELEEDVVVAGNGRYYNVVEAAERNPLFLEVGGVWRGGAVSVEHRKDGAGVGVDGNVDLGLAVGGSERHAVGDGPEGIGCGGTEEGGVC